MAAVNIDAGQLMSGMSIKVKITGLNLVNVRIWAGCLLIKLAGYVIGAGQIEIDV